MIELLTPNWNVQNPIEAICTTRLGGVSRKPFGELNLATHVDDKSGDVIINREILVEDLSLPSAPVWLNQIHSSIVAEVSSTQTGSWSDVPEAIADGSFTREVGVVLGILVADCLPVLLVNHKHQEIAVLHAGWRGLAGGIIQNGVEKFTSRDISAWIGPGIAQCHYEVGADLKEKFPSEFTRPGRDSEHWMLDLAGVAVQLLGKAGVLDIYQAKQCTYCDPEKLYSFRRDRKTGRMAALIWIRDR